MPRCRINCLWVSGGIPSTFFVSCSPAAASATKHARTRTTYRPDLDVVPIYHGMDAHELRPALVCRIEVRQELPVRVGPPGTQEYRPDSRPVPQVRLERLPHGQRIPFEIEVVVIRRARHEVFNLGKWMGRHDVYRLKRPAGSAGIRGQNGFGFGGRRRRRRAARKRGPRGQAGEYQDEEDEAVLAAVI